MAPQIAHSRNGVPVRLTEERWQHVLHRHPEMAGQRERVLGSLREPDMIQQGDFGEIAGDTLLSRNTVDQQVSGCGLSGDRSRRWVHPNSIPGRRAIGWQDNNMEALKILEKPAAISWDYDEQADVLYLSVGEPKPAIGIDIGEGVVVRYDEARREVVGLTLLGLRARILRGLAQSH